MASVNLADRSLVLAASRLTTGQPARRITARWAGDTQLDGWTPHDLLDALTQRNHPHHDTLVSGLIRHSQHHDDDASILLLGALRPALWTLAHTYHRARLHTGFDDLLVSAVHVIARADPTIDRLYDRLVGRIRAATPPQHPQRHELSMPDFDDRADGGEDDIIDQLTARDRLRLLGELHRSGAINNTAWNDLIAVRVHAIPTRDLARGRSTDHVRADISRLSRHLEQLLAA